MRGPTKQQLRNEVERLREACARWATAAGQAAERTRRLRARTTKTLRELRAQLRVLQAQTETAYSAGRITAGALDHGQPPEGRD